MLVQTRWFIVGAVIAFLVPYIGSSILDLHHDFYLLLYMTSVIALLFAYVRSTSLDAGALIHRHWKTSLLLGVGLLVPIVMNVLSEDGTRHPSGVYFWFEILWRGGLYGAIDALLLTAFPCAIVLSVLGGRLDGVRRKLTYLVASLVLIATITATYHLGYEQYRRDGVRAPEIGNVLMSLPALLTANPIGSVIDHSAMHIAAVSHEYETDVRLPPQTDVNR